ncbi:hypothetical protein HPB50_026018 [Hyalomma asiaticum]|uniref:Uncharacterized protein n=1 Tax=Hyalomma asiaticum TaxID=266040 RepID=A0ACB7TQV3_HYAAI|nr:hypothetical protein HPB50_026018 [Hyalomma asiaticum]
MPIYDSGYGSCTTEYSLFRAPKEIDGLKRWAGSIKRREKEFNRASFVCEKHFESRFNERSFKTVVKTGVLISTTCVGSALLPPTNASCPGHHKAGTPAVFSPSWGLPGSHTSGSSASLAPPGPSGTTGERIRDRHKSRSTPT